jgi:hypothetical protein
MYFDPPKKLIQTARWVVARCPLVVFVLCALGWSFLAQGQNFSHAQHLKKTSECSSCHAVKGTEIEYTRPGHSACKSCHKSHNFDSADVSAGICKSCHGDSSAQIKTFPDRSRGIIALRSGGFSHQGHLDSDGSVSKKVGKITCGTCHSFDTTGKASMPKHKECSLCHSESNASAGMPIIGGRAATKDCNSCHDDAKKDKTVRPGPRGSWDGLAFYSPDVDFDHVRHQNSSNQACNACHDGVQKSKETAAERRHLPSMYTCKDCHEDNSKVSAQYQMQNCVACHQEVRQSERPKPPYHYGSLDHQTGSKNERLYCAYCHNKKPEKFKPQPKYKDSCESCHASEGVSPNLSRSKEGDGQIGLLTAKNGISSSFATSLDLKRGRAFDALTDVVDQNDIDVQEVASIDIRGVGLDNIGASFLGRFNLDPGLTTAFSQFENAYTLDQQPPADRGSVLSNGPIDRRQLVGAFVYRGYAEIRQQPLFGALSFDARLGRQSVFEGVTPVFFDGGYAKLNLGDKLSANGYVGSHVNFFTTDPNNDPVFGFGLKAIPTDWLGARIDFMDYLAPMARAEVQARATPYTWLRFGARLESDRLFDAAASTDLNDEQLALTQIETGVDYFNEKSLTAIELDFIRRFDAGVFDYDYSNVTTQMGTFAPDGRQLFDYENVNFGTLPNYRRFAVRVRQPIGDRLTASLFFARRKLLDDPTAVIDEGFDQLNDADALANLNEVLRAVALDNRVAYAMTYTEIGPGLDTNNLFASGLRLSAKLVLRAFDPFTPEEINGAINQQGAFFSSIAGEGETSQVKLSLGASQKFDKFKLSAFFETQSFNYQGRYVQLENLDILSVNTTAQYQINKRASLQLRYAFSNDMVLFDNNDLLQEIGAVNRPVASVNIEGEEVNTHDNIFTQRFFTTLLYRF